MSTRVTLTRVLTSYAAAAVAVSLPWPLLLVLAWDEYGGSGHGALAVGLTGAARMAPYVLLSWFVGSLGDRVCRHRLVVWTLALRLVCLAAVATALASGHLTTAVLAASLAVAVGTPAYPTVAASIPGLAGPDGRRVTDVLVTTEVAAWTVGPALGGLLLLPATRPWVPAIAVALMALALALMWGIRLPSPDAERRASVTVGGMLGAVRGTRPVVVALASAGLINIVVTVAAITLLPLTRDTWGLDDAAFGLATACLGFGALGAPLLWFVRVSDQGRRVGGLLCLGVAVAWVGVSPSVLLALPVLAVAGTASVVAESAITHTIQEGVADEHRAGALGLADSVMVAGALLGSFGAPILATAVGPQATLLACGLGCAAVTVPTLLHRRADQARRPVRASSRSAREASAGTSSRAGLHTPSEYSASPKPSSAVSITSSSASLNGTS